MDMKEIVVDLKDLKITGSILDISQPGNVVIPEIVNSIKRVEEDTIEKDYFEWENNEIACDMCVYDNAFAFFSLNKIGSKKSIDRIIKEVRRVLREEGKIKIWDVNVPLSRMVENYKIKVQLSDEKIVRMRFKTYLNPFRVKFVDIIKLLENNSFKIVSSNISGDMYYIEAEKYKEVKEVKDDSNFSST
jgi:hypothetical protein